MLQAGRSFVTVRDQRLALQSAEIIFTELTFSFCAGADVGEPGAAGTLSSVPVIWTLCPT
jgi:hypothetical protein